MRPGASQWGGGHGTLCFAPPVPCSHEHPEARDRMAGQAEAGVGGAPGMGDVVLGPGQAGGLTVKAPGYGERHLALSPSSALISGCSRTVTEPL